MKTLRSLLLALSIVLGTLTASFVSAPAYAQAPAPAPTSSCTGVLSCMQSFLQGANGKTYDQYYQENAAYMNSGGSNGGITQCWGCLVFNSFVSNLMNIGQTSAAKLDPQMKAIMVAFASVFSLFYLGGSFVAGDASDLVSRWKVFWRLCIAVACGGAWLNGSSFANTWNYVYYPIMSVPIGVESTVVSSVGGANGTCTETTSPPPGLPGGAQQAVLAMGKVVCGAHKLTVDNIAKGIAIAESGDGWFDKVVHWVAGGFVIVIFFWLMISFPLRFIDVLIRLSIVGIVTPVMVVCAVFKPTRGYCMVAVNNVLNAACQFAFTGVMFAIGQQFFTQTVDKYTANFASDSEVQIMMACGVICACALLFGSMVKMAPGIASEFSQFSASAGGVGAQAESMARGAASAPGTALMGAGGMAVSAVGGIAGAAIGGAAAGYTVKKMLGKDITPPTGGGTGGGGG